MATACPGKNFPFDEIKKVKTAPKKEKVEKDTYTQEQFIRDVQSATGSAVDGIAGRETIGNTITVSKVFNRKHKVVKAIQKRLNALGYNCGEVDGIAGVKFDSAVKAYQKDNGCVVDGIITAQNKTWKKLLGMI
jgi:peptidoglycan hydrolase-like protein with peptidoglycan-binding domain